MRTLDADVKHGNRPARAPRENHRPRLGDVTRAARAVNRERDMVACFELCAIAARPSTRAARRTSLRGAESEALDHAARPLAVEIDRVQHHDAAFPPDPHRRKNAAVPKRADSRLARRCESVSRCARRPLRRAASARAGESASRRPTRSRESACGASAKAAAWRLSGARRPHRSRARIFPGSPLRYSIGGLDERPVPIRARWDCVTELRAASSRFLLFCCWDCCACAPPLRALKPRPAP